VYKIPNTEATLNHLNPVKDLRTGDNDGNDDMMMTIMIIIIITVIITEIKLNYLFIYVLTQQPNGQQQMQHE
jgi:hypothetical protein